MKLYNNEINLVTCCLAKSDFIILELKVKTLATQLEEGYSFILLESQYMNIVNRYIMH